MMFESSSHFLIWLVPCFFITAAVYASVGFGGGSTYLALLTLAGISYSEMPMVALICNILVVLLGGLLFFKDRDVEWKLVLPFLLTSIPAAYFGGHTVIGKQAFFFLLGVSLLMAALRLYLRLNDPRLWLQPSLTRSLTLGLPMGAGLGFLSGLTGIGGGIFLVPVLYFLRWGNPRRIAAAASVFILVNSISGLMGQWTKVGHGPSWELMAPLVLAVMAGGWLGHQIGFGALKPFRVQRMTAGLIFFIAITVLWKWHQL